MLLQTDFLTRLRDFTAPQRRQLEDHPLYREIYSLGQLRIFLQAHVFAVWDFMSLLKSLQASVTCVNAPWAPSAYPQSRRLINEIVLGEESDSFQSGFLSHFEVYLQAMSEAGADTSAIDSLLKELSAGRTLAGALSIAQPPSEALTFVRSTFSFIDTNKPHVAAAAFTFGREDLIPDMFRQMVKDLRRNFENVALFEYYLDRHIEVDGDSHGPMALQMVEELCGGDDRKWDEAASAARSAMAARIALWDGILKRIRSCNYGH